MMFMTTEGESYNVSEATARRIRSDHTESLEYRASFDIIFWIKTLRIELGCGLKEAKELVYAIIGRPMPMKRSWLVAESQTITWQGERGWANSFTLPKGAKSYIRVTIEEVPIK
jgi:hypothetical protein